MELIKNLKDYLYTNIIKDSNNAYHYIYVNLPPKDYDIEEQQHTLAFVSMLLSDSSYEDRWRDFMLDNKRSIADFAVEIFTYFKIEKSTVNYLYLASISKSSFDKTPLTSLIFSMAVSKHATASSSYSSHCK